MSLKNRRYIMRLSNKAYDFLKWFALVALPAFQVFWLTVGKVWGFPYLTEIGATIGATGLFIAALLGLSSKSFTDGAAIHPDETPLADDWDEPLEGGEED